MFILETGSQKMILKVLIVRKKLETYVAKLTYKKLYINPLFHNVPPVAHGL